MTCLLWGVLRDDPSPSQLLRERRTRRRKAWLWVLFFVLLGFGGRLAYLEWGLSAG